MSTSLILMIVCFLALMIIGLPIAYNLLITTVVYLLSADLNIVQLAIKMYGGMNSFSFLAVPFFVLTGQLMLRGGLLESLVKFVNVWFGNFKGAIAIVTIGASLLMGSIVGLAVASAASLGVFLIPMMKKEGYSPAYSAAVMSSASLLGPIMPPSVLMILYCTAVGNTSIAGLFMAAVTPAILIALMQCVIADIRPTASPPGRKKDRLPLRLCRPSSCRSSSSAVYSAVYSRSPKHPALQSFTVRSSLSL